MGGGKKRKDDDEEEGKPKTRSKRPKRSKT